MHPQGVTVVLIDPQGRVASSASDFDTGTPAGSTQREMQMRRAKLACAVDYVTAACNGYLAAVIRKGFPGAEGIVRDLVKDQGFRLHVIEHGYPPSE